MRDRSAFGYMEPSPDIADFAQCGSCQLWLANKELCYWLRPKDEVQEYDSCILYVQGDPITDDHVNCTSSCTPQEVGFHKGAVRCENCTSFAAGLSACNLYSKLNEEFPQLFKLKTKVKPHACCNAFD